MLCLCERSLLIVVILIPPFLSSVAVKVIVEGACTSIVVSAIWNFRALSQKCFGSTKVDELKFCHSVF